MSARRRASETPEVFSFDAQTARDTTRKTKEPNDDRLTTDPEPQQIRGVSQDFKQFSNGDAQIEMNRPRKDGGSENADAGQACCPRATCCSGEEAYSSWYSDAKRGASSAQPYRRLSA